MNPSEQSISRSWLYYFTDLQLRLQQMCPKPPINSLLDSGSQSLRKLFGLNLTYGSGSMSTEQHPDNHSYVLLKPEYGQCLALPVNDFLAMADRLIVLKDTYKDSKSETLVDDSGVKMTFMTPDAMTALRVRTKIIGASDDTKA